jgi:hypothetical protein
VDANGLRRFRVAFKRHLEKLDPLLKNLDVVAKGSTDYTIKSYVEGVRQFSHQCSVALLVDADGPVPADTPARHIEAKLNSAHVPPHARSNVFLMVQCMESWLVADAALLESCFGNKLRPRALPQNPDLESVSKKDVATALNDAVKETPAGKYHKVRDAARILELLSPAVVAKRSKHARMLHQFLLNAVRA